MNLENFIQTFKEFNSTNNIIYNNHNIYDVEVFLKNSDNLNLIKNTLIIFHQDIPLETILESIEKLASSNTICIFKKNEDFLRNIPYSKQPILILNEEKEKLNITYLNILKEINKEKTRLIEANHYANNSLMHLNLTNASPQEYIDLLASITDKDIIYYSILNDRVYKRGEIFLSENTIKDLKLIDNKIHYLHKLELSGILYGYIVLNVNRNMLSDNEKSILEYIASMLIIKIQNKIAIDNSRDLVKSDLIADICMNNIKSKEEVVFRSNLQGWQIDSGLLCVIFDIDEFKYSILHSNKTLEQLEDEKTRIYKLIIKEMYNMPYLSYYYQKSDSIIFLVNSNLSASLSQLDSFIHSYIEPIHKLLNTKNLSYTLTVGVGTYYSDIMDTYKSYNEAVESINISRVFKEVDNICCYKDVIILKDLMEVMSKKDYHSIYRNLIKNIMDSDEKNNTEYLKTLQSIIKHDWNLKSSCEDLFIHYNTIIYRFEKIKDFLGMDLTKYHEKLMISLTVMLLEVEKHINFNKGIFKN